MFLFRENEYLCRLSLDLQHCKQIFVNIWYECDIMFLQSFKVQVVQNTNYVQTSLDITYHVALNTYPKVSVTYKNFSCLFGEASEINTDISVRVEALYMNSLGIFR